MGGLNIPAAERPIDRLKRVLKPLAISSLGRLPSTELLSGLGQILMFHRVVPRETTSPFGMAAFELTPQTLRSALDFFLRRGYRIVSLDQVCASLSRRQAPGKLIALTFDDGYRDTITDAYPILKEYGAPFTVFITWKYVERAVIKWDYLAEEIVLNNRELPIDTPEGRMRLDLSTPERKARAADYLQGLLYKMSDEENSPRIEAFFRQYVRDPLAKTDELMLDWAEVEQLARDPLVTIGAHSLSHFVLSRLPGARARDEIGCSKEKLESRLGVAVDHFAYPFGRLHEAGPREYAAVTQSGFKTGSTGVKGNLFQEHSARLAALPRFCIGGRLSRAYFAAIANGTLALVSNRCRRIPPLN